MMAASASSTSVAAFSIAALTATMGTRPRVQAAIVTLAGKAREERGTMTWQWRQKLEAEGGADVGGAQLIPD